MSGESAPPAVNTGQTPYTGQTPSMATAPSSSQTQMKQEPVPRAQPLYGNANGTPGVIELGKGGLVPQIKWNVRSAKILKKCNCKASHCLKLYCECFASSQFCENCNCKGCKNTPTFADLRRQAICNTLERNPNAFRPKIATSPMRDEILFASGLGRNTALIHNKGCHCKKSRCRKKYCECFQAGILCSDRCKCQDCANFEPQNSQLARSKRNPHTPAPQALFPATSMSMSQVAPAGLEFLQKGGVKRGRDDIGSSKDSKIEIPDLGSPSRGSISKSSTLRKTALMKAVGPEAVGSICERLLTAIRREESIASEKAAEGLLFLSGFAPERKNRKREREKTTRSDDEDDSTDTGEGRIDTDVSKSKKKKVSGDGSSARMTELYENQERAVLSEFGNILEGIANKLTADPGEDGTFPLNSIHSLLAADEEM